MHEKVDQRLQVADAFDLVLGRIAQAAQRSGRTLNDITVVAVSKGVATEAISAAVGSGARVFGENRVQEAIDKFSEGIRLIRGVEVHLVGSLQTNKVKKAVGFFDLIHSIDSVSLAEKVSEEASKRSIDQPVLVQVNIGEEAAKRGISVKEAPSLVESVRKLPHLSLLGLMTIAPKTVYPEEARSTFSKLRVLGVSLGLHRFSMGMSNDFDVAIEEGATWVRIGTAIFGGAPPAK